MVRWRQTQEREVRQTPLPSKTIRLLLVSRGADDVAPAPEVVSRRRQTLDLLCVEIRGGYVGEQRAGGGSGREYLPAVPQNTTRAVSDADTPPPRYMLILPEGGFSRQAGDSWLE